jgi:hypothetical protein
MKRVDGYSGSQIEWTSEPGEVNKDTGVSFPEGAVSIGEILTERFKEMENSSENSDSKQRLGKVKRYIKENIPDFIASVETTKLTLKASEKFKAAVKARDFDSLAEAVMELPEAATESFNGTYLKGIARIAKGFPEKGPEVDMHELWEHLDKIIS